MFHILPSAPPEGQGKDKPLSNFSQRLRGFNTLLWCGVVSSGVSSGVPGGPDLLVEGVKAEQVSPSQAQ